MTGFNGRPTPNVSRYIAGLNTIPTASELAAQHQDFGIDEDLALFTSTEFFDYDLGHQIPNLAQPVGHDATPDGCAWRQSDIASFKENSGAVDFSNNDFQNFTFTDFPNLVNDPPPADVAPTQPNAYHLQQLTSPTLASPTASISSPDSVPHTGDKRKLDATVDGQNMEEDSRMAAEEDKRRRNTAASARFRVKKKQKEQQLEKTATDMTAKVEVLQIRVEQLELENKWLKGLITEKSDGHNDVAEKNQRLRNENAESRSIGASKDGVGTISVASN